MRQALATNRTAAAQQPLELAAPSLAHAQAKAMLDALDVSDATRKDYKARVGLFVDWMAGRPFTPNTLREYKRHLQQLTKADGQPYKPASLAKYFAVARVLCAEGVRLGLLNFDPTANVRGQFVDDKKHKRHGLNHTQALAAMAAAKQHGAQAHALLAVLLYQGLRQAEAAALTWQDVDAQRKLLAVLGKGRSSKEWMPLHPHALAALQAHRPAAAEPTAHVFTSTANRNRGQGLTVRSVNRLVMAVLERAGIDGVTAHGTRHYFTTQLIRKGLPLTTVQRYTRHRTLEMLTVYNDEVSHEASLPAFYEAFGA